MNVNWTPYNKNKNMPILQAKLGQDSNTVAVVDRPLSCAESQQPLFVSRIELPDILAIRVKAMGICVGRPLHVVRDGDPLIIGVSGTHVGISRDLADSIFVKSTSAAAPIVGK